MSAPYGDRYAKALELAARWHGDHRKKGSDVPYLSHLLSVSALVWEGGGDETEAIAALLHDAVEDGAATIDEVREAFDDDVAAIVWDCSDVTEPGDHKPPWFDRKIKHIHHLESIVTDQNASPTMRVVAADKIANVRSILVDLRADRRDLWDQFKGGQGGSVWYYGEMSRVVERRLPGTILSKELRFQVDQLAASMARGSMVGVDEQVAEVLGSVAVRDHLDATDALAFELVRTVAPRPADDRGAATSDVLDRWFGPARDDLEPGSEQSRRDLITAVRGVLNH